MVQAIATEPPYERAAEPAVRRGVREMARVLAGGGRLAMLVAAWQRAALVAEAAELGLIAELDCPVDRNGLPVAVLVWRRLPDPTRDPTG
jgi:hypothetical protein